MAKNYRNHMQLLSLSVPTTPVLLQSDDVTGAQGNTSELLLMRMEVFRLSVRVATNVKRQTRGEARHDHKFARIYHERWQRRIRPRVAAVGPILRIYRSNRRACLTSVSICVDVATHGSVGTYSIAQALYC